MHLICPNCGCERTGYTPPTRLDGVYGPTGQRFTCRECGYTGPLIIDVDPDEAVEGYRKFPTSWVLILAITSFSAIALGAGIQESLLFFIILSSILVIFFYLIKQDEFQTVEEDLKNLDQDGRPLNKGF
ncbi:MAG: hypothetical protein U9Q22_07745 [Candidatus Altiarchaeota archaeon]|nr:hypothetical protein [Candidatus Altiarchaeota archaeon]